MSSIHDMRDTSVSSVRTVKFDGKDFQWWSYQIRALITGQGCWSVIEFKDEESFIVNYREKLLEDMEGSKVDDGESSEADMKMIEKDCKSARMKFRKMRESVYSMLVLAFDRSTSHLIMNCARGDAYAVWQNLLNHYERQTLASKLTLKQAFHSQRMGSKSFAEYSEGIVQIANRLQQMGSPVGDDDKLAALFAGLSEEFEQIKVSLTSRAVAPTFHDACDVLADYSLQRSLERGRTGVRGEQAYYGADTRGKPKGKEMRKAVTCYNCDEVGHISRECSKPRKGGNGHSNRGGTRVFKGTCFICGKKGHPQSKCELLKRAKKLANESANVAVERSGVWDEFSNEFVGVANASEASESQDKSVGSQRWRSCAQARACLSRGVRQHRRRELSQAWIRELPAKHGSRSCGSRIRGPRSARTSRNFPIKMTIRR